MKNSTFNFIMSAIVITFTILVVMSNRYTEQTKSVFTAMEKPVKLIYKEKITFFYSVMLQDANGNVVRFGNMSKFANNIGDMYGVGDTIDFKVNSLLNYKN